MATHFFNDQLISSILYAVYSIKLNTLTFLVNFAFNYDTAHHIDGG